MNQVPALSYKSVIQFKNIFSLLIILQIHAPTKGATSEYIEKPVISKFQSTLPRREQPGYGSHLLIDRRISIHAPTKGATAWDMSMSQYIIFQSTLPRRERLPGMETGLRICIDFNPRSHEGSDNFRLGYMLLNPDFNPRSHEGSDEKAYQKDIPSGAFQSTLPRRERPRLTISCRVQ